MLNIARILEYSKHQLKAQMKIYLLKNSVQSSKTYNPRGPVVKCGQFILQGKGFKSDQVTLRASRRLNFLSLWTHMTQYGEGRKKIKFSGPIFIRFYKIWTLLSVSVKFHEILSTFCVKVASKSSSSQVSFISKSQKLSLFRLCFRL